jgi:hypothetical protein
MRILIAILLASAAMAAQTQNVEVEPITCWWRTTATAVRIGEPFTVILTCSVLQTEAARVIPDESRLEPSVVQLPPFEVIGGSHAKDVTTAGRRFFQYDYRLRAIAENVFGTTASLPALEITYRVESRVAAGDQVQGRDQTYALPQLAVRVLSTVPDAAIDIREAPVATFKEVEDVGFRGTVMRVTGWVLVAIGALLVLLAIAGAAQRRRTTRSRARLLSDVAILRGVRSELESIREQSRGGWTSDLAGRALAAIRIVAAYVAGRPVTQHLLARGKSTSGPVAPSPGVVQPVRATTATDGQLTITSRFGGSALVSAAMTGEHAGDELKDALARFAAARYGREAAFDARLDDDLETAMRTVDRLVAGRPALERLWPR